MGAPVFTSSIGTEDSFRNIAGVRVDQRQLASDPDTERSYRAPQRAVLAEYVATLDRMKLDGFVYPAIQMPPPDETMPQDGRVSEGPHSATSWVNMIGVPAVVVPAGFYDSGLPFGLEFLGATVDGRGLVRYRTGVGEGGKLAGAAEIGRAGAAGGWPAAEGAVGPIAITSRTRSARADGHGPSHARSRVPPTTMSR